MPNSLSNMPRQEMPLGYNHALSTEHLSDEIKFLIACCKTDPTNEDIDFIFSFIQNSTFNIQHLLTLSSQHGVLPLIYKTIKKIVENDPYLNATRLTLNTKILTELKAHYMSISQRNMLMSAELIRIMKLLEANGIEALAFKGPALAEMAYGDITLRQFSDLDILIMKKDRFKMIDLLLKEQYIPEIDLKQGTKETFFNSVNVIGFHNPSTGIRIEVHWELLSRNYAINWEEKSLWNKQEHILINNKEIPVLVFEQQLLYLCAHGAKHLFERLEWICDIERSVRMNPNIDWEHLLNEAEKLGIKRMLYLGLALSQHFLGFEVPKMVKKNIVQDKKIPKLISKVIEMNFSKNFQEGKSFGTFGLLLSMRENLSDQLQFTCRGLFTPKFDDFTYLQLPKYLAFLYPLVRLYRLMKKYF